MSRKSVVTVCALVAFVLLLYAPSLGRAPIYLAHDEVFVALNAHSIASTGRDVNGRMLPLYFQMYPDVSNNIWFQPMIMYVTALFLTLRPVSEATIRWPSVCIGIADVVLLYFLAKRILQRERLAVVAAVLLALTPAHFIHSRVAMDYLYPVPFVIAWLLCLLAFVERRQRWLLFTATALLGIGFYSYIASVVMMPLYFVLTCLTLFMLCERPKPLYLVAAAGFVLPLLLLIPWFLNHPTAVAQTAQRYDLVDKGLHPFLSASSAEIPGLGRRLNFGDLTGRVSLYWCFLDPSYLFLRGGGNPVNSTQRAGVFLLPLAAFLLVGLNEILNARRTWVHTLLLLGFLSAPLAACLVPEPYAIDRELEVLPFGVLIATIGVERLLSARRTLCRAAAIVLLALMPIQFAYFYVDYFTDYRARSAAWFERNIRAAVEEMIDRDRVDHAPAFYFSKRILYIDWYWHLYLIKHGREDLLARSTNVDATDLDVTTVAPGSELLMEVGDAHTDAWVRAGAFRIVSIITEPRDPPSFAILQR